MFRAERCGPAPSYKVWFEKNEEIPASHKSNIIRVLKVVNGRRWILIKLCGTTEVICYVGMSTVSPLAQLAVAGLRNLVQNCDNLDEVVDTWCTAWALPPNVHCKWLSAYTIL